MRRASHEQTEALIARLADELRPLPPLRPPLVRALIWLAYAALVVSAVVAAHGVHPDLLQRLATVSLGLEWLAALLTGVLSAVAAFHLALPDRSWRWALLPLPPLVLWVAGLGYGCFTAWIAQGPQGLVPGTSLDCLQSIVLISLPLGLALLWMIRHAAVVRPTLTAFCGALAVAALAASGLSLYHDLEAAVTILVWHLGTTALVVAVGTLIGPRLLRWVRPRA